MMAECARIANAQGFWGDRPSAAADLIKKTDVDYLTLDYLAEVSLSIMAIQKEKDPQSGYARDFVEVIKGLIPFWKAGKTFKVVTNAGGLSPKACAQACQQLLSEHGCEQLKIAVVSGDDVLGQLRHKPDEPSFRNMDNGQSLSSISPKLVTANAYLGAAPLVDALHKGADIVITGRVADPSLTVACAQHHFGWHSDNFNALAGATIAGHLIECGTQMTGGIYTRWLELEDVVDLGFPIAEVHRDGSCILTKAPGSGGRVSVDIVKEQLLYEIGDPANYLSPDAKVSLLDLDITEVGKDRVKIKGAIGKAPPQDYKVSATYKDGYRVEGMLTVFGQQAVAKARRCGQVIIERVRRAGFDLKKTQVECLGAGDCVPGLVSAQDQEKLIECVLRIAAADPRKEALECLAKELAPLVTGGAPGITGYASGRPKVRPVFGFWPCLIARGRVQAHVEILEPCLK